MRRMTAIVTWLWRRFHRHWPEPDLDVSGHGTTWRWCRCGAVTNGHWGWQYAETREEIVEWYAALSAAGWKAPAEDFRDDRKLDARRDVAVVDLRPGDWLVYRDERGDPSMTEPGIDRLKVISTQEDGAIVEEPDGCTNFLVADSTGRLDGWFVDTSSAAGRAAAPGACEAPGGLDSKETNDA